MILSLPEFESLRDEWNALAASTRTPLLEHDWLLAAIRAFHAEVNLRIVAVRDRGELVAAAPLVYDPARRRLVTIGSAYLFEPADWLASSAEAMGALATAVLDLGMPFAVERVPRAGAVVEALTHHADGRALALLRDAGHSHYVDTSGSWEQCVARFSRKGQRALRQTRATLERDVGPIDIRVEHPRANASHSCLERFAELEARGWKGRHGSAIRSRPHLARFFLDYLGASARCGRFRMTTLSVVGTPIAMELAIEAHSRLWTVKIAYDESFDAHGPGVQLTQASMRAACGDGLSAYEFLGTAESWQERWHPSRREHALVVGYPRTWRGLTTIGVDVLDYVRQLAERRWNDGREHA